MRQGNPLRTIALLTLLMPGLVLAAPTAGACGHCDSGSPCATMAAPEPVVAAHSCCGGDSPATPARPAPASPATKACNCGHEAPAAVSAAAVPALEDNRAEAHDVAVRCESTDHSVVATAASHRPPAPPPQPLIFLIDCVFLT